MQKSFSCRSTPPVVAGGRTGRLWRQWAWAAGWVLLAGGWAGGQVLINEVLYQRPNKDPARPNTTNEYLPATKAVEFIELHNPTAAAVDLSGWRIGGDGVSFLFPAGASIAAGGYVCVAQNPEHFTAQFTGVTALGPWTGVLKRNSGQIRLLNAVGAEADVLDYQAGFPWPTAAKGGGESMELIHPGLDRTLAGSWRASGSPFPPIALGSGGWHWRKGTSEASTPIEAWRQPGFVEDATWFSEATPEGGTAPFGFGITGVTWGTILSDMRQVTGGPEGYSSVYFRYPFTLTEDQIVDTLRLRLFADDGAIVWLNGTEVGRTRAPAEPTYNAESPSSAPANGGTAVAITVAEARSLLRAGANVLAVQAFNQVITGSDFRFDLEAGSGATGAVKNPTPGRRNSMYSVLAPPAIRQVVHTPEQPAANTPVVITAKITDPDGVGAVTLSYQKVEPGSYIPLQLRTSATAIAPNPAYSDPANWTTLEMRDDGQNGDAQAGDDIYSVTIPAAEQVHRRLIRYRLTAIDQAGTPSRVIVPYPDDEQPNFAYFCYNGVPEWKGAFRRTADAAGAATPAETYSADFMRSLQTYHLLARAADVTNSQTNSSYDSRRFYGTMIANGRIFDHMQFSNRGAASAYNTGKNKWRFNFNRARDVTVYDNLGRPWDQARGGFSFSACATPWASVNRGMAGLDETVSAKLYALAGTPSIKTFYLHFRVIDGAVETHETNQYEGDLWGLYLGMEDYERDWWQEHGLAEGNVYKLDGGIEQKGQAETLPANHGDWTTFNNQSTGTTGRQVSFWRQNMDLDAYYTYHAINRFVGNVDLRNMANAYYYHRSTDNRWVALPWDLDMMFIAKNHWYTSYTSASGSGSKNVPGVLAQHRLSDLPELAIELKNRQRELLDLVGEDGSPNGGQIGQLIDEFAQIVNPTGQALTWADLDAAMWNQNPKTSGSAGSASGQNNPKGNFYRTPWDDSRGVGGAGGNWRRWLRAPNYTGRTAEFEDFVKYLVDYTTNTYPADQVEWRINNAGLPSLTTSPYVQMGYGWKYLEFEAKDNGVPERPAVTYLGAEGYPTGDLRFRSSDFAPAATASTGFAAVEWRLGEISAPGIPGFDPTGDRIYEVQPRWTARVEAPFTAEVQLPAGAVRSGRTYRVRARHLDANGRWSRWSPATQFIAGAADVSGLKHNLLITEINYHPYPATGAETTAGFTDEDFEFLELKNIGTTTLDLTDVRFTKGVDFDVPAGTTLSSGAFALVVKNVAAFQMRYPTVPAALILGTFAPDSLSNSGEELKLSFGAGEPIHEFAYSDRGLWPSAADGNGPTLTLINPAGRPDLSLPESWKASAVAGGTPGADEDGAPPGQTYAQWAQQYPAAANPADDTDGDGLINRLEYALGGHPLTPDPGILPTGQVQELTVAGTTARYLTLTFTHPANLSDVTYEVQFSANFTTWSGGGVQVSATTNPDGSVTETWRSPEPAAAQTQYYVRLRIP